MGFTESHATQVRKGILKILEIKDSDIRILTLEQCRDAADKGLHAGGAFSAIVPLVSLYYGGFLDIDVENPTKRGQDMFTLSKGHAVAAMASIYAELGYFDRSLLKGSRSYASILNGHPGPVLPGVHIATGPMGQGIAVAQGFAISGHTSPRFDSYALCGDGELQEGPVWEAVMFAGQKKLDNFCVMVDQNNGQLDMANRMIFPTPNLEAVFASFDWNVHSCDATQYSSVFDALDQFRNGVRNGKPTAIICHTSKGHGAFSDFLNKHKVTGTDALMAQELALQADLRAARVADFDRYARSCDRNAHEDLLNISAQMNLDVAAGFAQRVGPVRTKRAEPRNKQICYDPAQLPKFDPKKEYAAMDVVTAAMKIFARDSRVVSVDSDLATTSGLEAGIAAVDQKRALNVGVAEANMMNLGEAFAALGYNAWVSTFCPFFDWKVMRRIAVGHQERLEAISAGNNGDPNGWLSEGHGLDLTYLATAPNFETRTNGATHMGNDDITIFDGMAHLKIIDVSCPEQLLAIMKWIMAGNQGINYVRVMRTGSAVLYPAGYEFQFGKATTIRESATDSAVIISSGRGVHEALATATLCAEKGLGVTVIDMPSVDEECLLSLCDTRKLVIFAEQNNGYLWSRFIRTTAMHRKAWAETLRVIAINTLDDAGNAQFIHSGTYEELLDAFELSPAQLAQTIIDRAS
jgi:transketolase